MTSTIKKVGQVGLGAVGLVAGAASLTGCGAVDSVEAQFPDVSKTNLTGSTQAEYAKVQPIAVLSDRLVQNAQKLTNHQSISATIDEINADRAKLNAYLRANGQDEDVLTFQVSHYGDNQYRHDIGGQILEKVIPIREEAVADLREITAGHSDWRK